MSRTEQPDYLKEAKKLIASIAIRGSEKMPSGDRIMVHHGIAELFPTESPEHKEAKDTAYALATAEKKQLKLTQLLES